MDTNEDDNDPVSHQAAQDSDVTDEVAAAESDPGEEKMEASPNQPLDQAETPHAPYAPHESASDDEGVTSEVETSKVLGEAETEPAADQAARGSKAEFLVEDWDLPGTAQRACALMSSRRRIFQRGGVLVELRRDMARGRLIAREMSAVDITSAVHAVAQPYTIRKRGGSPQREEISFPERAARLCQAPDAVAKAPELRGITHSPLLGADGSIRCVDGYDSVSGLYCHNVPVVIVPNRATERAVQSAFRRLRGRIKTFPFADAILVRESGFSAPVVDNEQLPGADESAYFTALLTAVCRPSLPLVPGLLVTAPYLSGAGTGKGMLARFIAEVAYGMSPTAMTMGHNADELDKRLAAVLMTAAPIVLLDNVNATELRSNLLASAITENPAQVRVLRTSTLVQLNPSTFICVTGNGLGVTEDLRRRFLEVQLNPGMENPEARSFEGDFLAEARRDRAEILSDVLTIVTWGMQQGGDLPRGRPLGSFEAWSRMCRDPLLALGCKDPVEEIARRHASDSQRSEVAELFEVWWLRHGSRPMEANELHQDVWNLLAPYGEARQRVTERLKSLDGTFCGGFRLRLIPKSARWSRNKYKLENTGSSTLEPGHFSGGGNSGGLGGVSEDFEGLGAMEQESLD